MKLYTELANWWPLLSPPEDYAEEASYFINTLNNHAESPVTTMLELGAGGGNNAYHIKQHATLTLTDHSQEMLQVSQQLNPECRHIAADMKTLRLNETFEAVFLHDAVMYLVTEHDLQCTWQTAAHHLRPGGIALFVPDFIHETFQSQTTHDGHDGENRALRYLEWTTDPDPTDSTFTTDRILILKDGSNQTTVEHIQCQLGLFPESVWRSLMKKAGFEPIILRPTYEGAETVRCFLGIKQ
jgi:SAM-dependent methyltransferase